MNFDSMSTPDTREEFEHRFHLLRESLSTGRLKVAAGLETGLERVRYLPNGRIEILSIDETARLSANSMMMFAGRFKDDFERAVQEGDTDS